MKLMDSELDPLGFPEVLPYFLIKAKLYMLYLQCYFVNSQFYFVFGSVLFIVIYIRNPPRSDTL